MPCQGDIAAVAGVIIRYTHVPTFILSVRVTLLGAGVPLVSAGVTTFPPAIFIRTVAGSVTLGVDGVGGTSLGTIVVTRL